MTLESEGFPIGRCHGPLLDSVGICSMGPLLFLVYSGYVRISDEGSTLRADGMDCRVLPTGHDVSIALNSSLHDIGVPIIVRVPT